MVHNGNCGGARGVRVTRADLEEELHRIRESRLLLILTAEKVGLSVPRSCCPHRGETACESCSADWLVAHLRLASTAVQ
jgi:hypothetical protein